MSVFLQGSNNSSLVPPMPIRGRLGGLALVLMGLAAVSPSYAQPVNLVVPNPAVAGNLYAQQQITMGAGFSATTPGFEARIKLPEATAGRWSTPLLWTDYKRYADLATTPPNNLDPNAVTGMIAIHTHLLPNGKVLSWEGHNDDKHVNAGPGIVLGHAYEWNPNPFSQNGSQAYPYVYNHYDNAWSNIFCSGHSFLADGRLLVTGGHYSAGKVYRTPANTPQPYPVDDQNSSDFIPGTGDVYGYIGVRDVNIFNYKSTSPNNFWQTSSNRNLSSALNPMRYRRWYPTNTTLADGRVLVVAGQQYGGINYNDPAVQAIVPEVYNPTTGSVQQVQAVIGGVTTPASRQLPFYPWMFQAPDGRVFNAGPNVRTGFLNLTTAPINGTSPNTWTDGPVHRLAGNPTSYDYYTRYYGTAAMYQPGKILMLGGSGTTAEMLDLNVAGAAWQQAAPLQYARMHVNSTILPDGTVLVTGGTREYSSDEDKWAVLPAELWTPPASDTNTPSGGTWTTLNAMAVPRLYHSTAVLLPDATVLSAGGGQGGAFQDHPDYEIFTPPYLCKGYERPVISSAPEAIAYGTNFTINTPNAGDIRRYGRATLVRLSSVTHSFNMNQRFLELVMPASSGTQLTLTPPSNPNTCPPGHYMLFLIASNGTPSHARIVVINASACVGTVALQQTVISQTECSKVTRFEVTVNGTISTASYNWIANGTSFGGTSYADITTNVNAPTAQVQVIGANNCGASATLTRFFPACAMPCPTCGQRPAPATQNTSSK